MKAFIFAMSNDEAGQTETAGMDAVKQGIAFIFRISVNLIL